MLNEIAYCYKERADELIDIAIKNNDLANEYTYPVLFLSAWIFFL